ncbi:MAG: hypothetical protein KC635_00160, partial [Myxococcales bacterium]|nr:hypothetical protein [Myxococcales bacterium]
TFHPTDLAFDGGSATVAAQTSGRWRYFKVPVPPTALGWDLRLTGVGSGRPRMVVRAELLPADFNTTTLGYAPFYYGTEWQSGWQWAPGADLTQHGSSALGDDETGRFFFAGYGAPVREGVYYVAVSDAWSTERGADLTYTLTSRGVGDGLQIPVTPLAYDGGSASVSGLSPRDVRVYSVDVPEGATSFALDLTPTAGDAMMVLARDHVPNSEASQDTTSVQGARRQKAGPDFFYRYPTYPYGQPTDGQIEAGRYYVVVGAEGAGAGAGYGTIGTGATAYSLTSHGEQTVKGGADLVITDGTSGSWPGETLRYGEQRAYRFTAPDDATSIEVRLTHHAGTPQYTLIDGTGPFPTPQQSYQAAEQGASWILTGDALTTLTDPRGVYTVLVTANAGAEGEVDADYDLTIEAKGLTPLAFNGGVAAVSAQESRTWRYFEVVVPEGALGWDLRLENVSGGRPRMVIARDTLPRDFNTTSYGYVGIDGRDVWPTGGQWGVGTDMTGFYYAPDGGDEYGRRVQMGMGSPLEPGVYHVGVSDAYGGQSGDAMSYELVSRGIGVGDDGDGAPWAIQVHDLAWDGGVATGTVAAREVAYYRVEVPPTATSWDVALAPAAPGDALLAVRRGRLPNASATGYTADHESYFMGARRQKNGDEHYYLSLDSGQAALNTGTWYLAVAGEGQGVDRNYSRAGSGDTAFTLTSRGPMTVVATSDAVGGDDGETPVRFAAQHLAYGEERVYRFTVPDGLYALAIAFENATGGPYAGVTDGWSGSEPVNQDPIPYPYGGGYGQHDHGAGPILYGPATPQPLQTLSPRAGTWTVTVVGGYGPNGEEPTDFDLVVRPVDEVIVTDPVWPRHDLAFNGGQVTVTGQPEQSWHMFDLVVPEGCLGWDLRLEDVTGGSPHLVIRRDADPPADYSPYWYLMDLLEWPTEAQWNVAGDLAQRPYGQPATPDGQGAVYEWGRRAAMGLGAPLEPGRYVVGVTDDYSGQGPMSYTIRSRGIGQGDDESGAPWAIQVQDIAFGVPVSAEVVPARSNVYYRVTVPEGLESFRAELTPTVGEAMLTLRKGHLPNSEAQSGRTTSDSGAGARRQKGGEDFFYRYPDYDQATVAGGVYYVAVAAEGQTPYSPSHYGAGASSWTLLVDGPIPVHGGTDQVVSASSGPVAFRGQTLRANDVGLYRLRVSPDVRAFEIRLENKTGESNFTATLRPYFLATLPTPNEYGYRATEGGSGSVASGTLAETIVGETGDLTIAVAAPASSASDSAFDVVVTPLGVTELAWDGGSAQVTLPDLGTRFFHVTVPEDCDGVAQAGWIVTQDTTAGSVQVSVRKGALPGDAAAGGQTLETYTRETIIVPPYLEPGDWYVRARASGSSSASITTREVKEARHWTMPARGVDPSVPGLAPPLFGDSGVLDDGSPVSNQGSDDQGVDLAQDTFRFYRVTVPPGNAGLFRTRVEAISGNPDLYIRRGAAPTLNYIPPGYGYLWDYADQLAGSTYGHWVVPDTRNGTELTPGEYWLAVHAKDSNVRYRLKVDVGTIADLAQEGGQVTGQALAAGDMRSYRVHVPQTSLDTASSTPLDWRIQLTQQAGDAVVFLREAVPAGLWSTVPQPGSGADYYLRDWNGDRNPYVYGLSQLPKIDASGTTTLSMPVLRPDTTYYLSVYARTDTVFDLASSVGAARQALDGVFPYTGAEIHATVPAGGRKLFRVDVPADGARWLQDGTVGDGVTLYLSQGMIPVTTGYADWTSYSTNADLDHALLNPDALVGAYPWVPGESYYLLAVNTGGAAAAVDLVLDGRARDDDSDADGLPDGWELEHFGYLYYGPSDDTDGDRLDNAAELALGTDPTRRDTDGDHVDDAAEIAAGSDPLAADSDDDHVCDASDSAPDDPSESGPVLRLVMHEYHAGTFGSGYGSDQHKTRLVAVFDKSAVKAHWLHVTGWDVEAADEVSVTLNGKLLGYLPVGGDQALSTPVLFWVDTDELLDGADANRLELRQKTAGEPWGVADLGLFTFGDTFGRDETGAYDDRHPEGFDIRWPSPWEDQLLEVRAFDLERADDVAITLDGAPLFDAVPGGGDLAWTPYYQVPVLGADYPADGVRVISVRPRGGSDGAYQLRIVDCRALRTGFGPAFGTPGELEHAKSAVSFLVPVKAARRELKLSAAVTQGGRVATTGTMARGPGWTATDTPYSPALVFCSDAGRSDDLELTRVEPAVVPEGAYATFGVSVSYYGEPIDSDNDGHLDCDDAFPNESDEWFDDDHDGLGDNWETFYFGGLDVASAGTDEDEDGVV